ncbi:MAG: hypothetical protein KBC16_01040 [Candidatus Pacebacteria bacterium]|nr:hypothetical protein [Candidatus Paceibacterota bacterium]
MKHELTNLLPRERTRAFRQVYFMRLLTLAAVLATVLVVVHGLLLMPTYLLLSAEASEAKKTLDTLTQSQAQNGPKDEAGQKLEALNSDALRLQEVGGYISATETISSVLETLRTGIAITRFTYAPPSASGEGRLSLTGRAESRTALDSFVKELRKNTRFSVIDLPISAYAKETNLEFTISISGDFTP